MWLALIPVIIEGLKEAPAAISAVRKIVEVIKAEHPPTAEEETAIEAALRATHDDLQA